jgi:hypothetical protein
MATDPREQTAHPVDVFRPQNIYRVIGCIVGQDYRKAAVRIPVSLTGLTDLAVLIISIFVKIFIIIHGLKERGVRYSIERNTRPQFTHNVKINYSLAERELLKQIFDMTYCLLARYIGDDRNIDVRGDTCADIRAFFQVIDDLFDLAVPFARFLVVANCTGTAGGKARRPPSRSSDRRREMRRPARQSETGSERRSQECQN